MKPLLSPLPAPGQVSQSVPTALYHRHLGWPAGVELDERLTELAEQTRDWYREHGTPWSDARQIAIQRITEEAVFLDHGWELRSSLLARGLTRAAAHALVLVAATAGAAVDERIDELWQQARPDEAMFLSAYAIAVVEHLRAQAKEHLDRSFHDQAMTVLPHYSPGYEGWELSDQETLYQAAWGTPLETAVPLRVLPSGGLWPAKSVLAAYAITARTDLVNQLSEFWSLLVNPLPYGQSAAPGYAFSSKALSLWRDKRLQLKMLPDQQLWARFRFDGSTCNNLGMPIAIDYEVSLEHHTDSGYRITGSSCQPAAGDVGFRSSCAYLDNPELHQSQVQSNQPLVGRPLEEALTWQPSVSQAGCLCSRASQDHKWRIVLQTIHYALEKS